MKASVLRGVIGAAALMLLAATVSDGQTPSPKQEGQKTTQPAKRGTKDKWPECPPAPLSPLTSNPSDTQKQLEFIGNMLAAISEQLCLQTTLLHYIDADLIEMQRH